MCWGVSVTVYVRRRANFLCVYSSVFVSYINQIKKTCNIVLLGYL
jgi:hypothetical protein